MSAEKLLELSALKGSADMPRQLSKRIRAAIVRHDIPTIEECAYEIQSEQLGRPRFDSENLEMLLALLRDASLLAMEGAGALLAPLEFDSDKLSRRQRRAVVEALEEAYPKFADRMAQFQITEFVGRKFADEEALGLFTRLMTTSEPEARGLISHGFEHLVCSGESETSQEAFARLQSMMSDASDQVVGETLLSLERITRNGRSFAQSARQLLRSAINHKSSGVRDLARSLIDHIDKQPIPH